MTRRNDATALRPRWRTVLDVLGTILLLSMVWASAALADESLPGVTFASGARHYTPSSYRTIKYIVIHTIEGSSAGAVSWFRNPRSEVSAHYIVGHSGKRIQMVHEKDIAWHAGNWSYNRHSIGIEHEGYADRNTWTEAQYVASAELSRAICDRYGIPKDRAHIVGHNEVPGATHHDPGRYFDWDHYMELVNADARPQARLRAEHLGRAARFTLEVRNPTRTRMRFDFAKLPLYDFAVRGPDGRVVYRWSAGRTFPAMVPPSKWLEPGQVARFWVVWEYPRDLAPGTYDVFGALLSRPFADARTTLTLRRAGTDSDEGGADEGEPEVDDVIDRINRLGTR